LPPFLVPSSSFTYQFPKSGTNHLLTTIYFKPNTPQSGRGYPRNKLKASLQAGKTYCFRLFFNISNNSTYGIDGLGACFTDATSDTILQSDRPITYLTPQVTNPSGNILMDTLNWNLLTGTFVATGTEEHLILGNFKTDASVNSSLLNPTHLPLIATDILFDNVSCIDIDLPADAGPDKWCIPGDSVFIGRQPDVGIDEACIWYKLPDMINAIDTVGGLWVKPVTTTTYMVKQDICGMVKYDTVVVYPSATGNVDSSTLFDGLRGTSGGLVELNLVPNPASDVLHIHLFNDELKKTLRSVMITNNLGQVLREEKIINDAALELDISALPEGIYHIHIFTHSNQRMIRKLVVQR
jgi:hypothetical protein